MANTDGAAPLLEFDDVTIEYGTEKGPLTAVSDVSFTIAEGEYFGLVGESGCGKSTIAQAILNALDDNGRVASGSIRYRGQDIFALSDAEMDAELRWNEVSYIPQGSMSSLDPLERISKHAWDIARTHTTWDRETTIAKFSEMFEVVGLSTDRINDYPHEFSGGMQQRAIIALALFLEPRLIIADEPTTALDVIMQDQIFKYLVRIREETDTAMMLITHDISLVFESCDRMGIMHSGQLAEIGEVHHVYDEPRHPYSLLLQEAFPDVRYPDRELGIIDGYPPETIGEIDFCTFHDRCPWAVPDCEAAAPPQESVDGTMDHEVACIRHDEIRELYAQGGREPQVTHSMAESEEVLSDE